MRGLVDAEFVGGESGDGGVEGVSSGCGVVDVCLKSQEKSIWRRRSVNVAGLVLYVVLMASFLIGYHLGGELAIIIERLKRKCYWIMRPRVAEIGVEIDGDKNMPFLVDDLDMI
ncbi:hypothetical protein NEHOM01_1615 [Nematocida homosporus]|uniref:uncharacterized protein n=1 Tax=Nematocida homosporus TaxID=1912981 RepID=UPI00221F1517|nr:uncharacterized protein NEHOM01_1615 [Nematocida homosporus]KAI5186662.1 hypothetical protein NEHOM01_1615 [Nematocida homosporus]